MNVFRSLAFTGLAALSLTNGAMAQNQKQARLKDVLHSKEGLFRLDPANDPYTLTYDETRRALTLEFGANKIHTFFGEFDASHAGPEQVVEAEYVDAGDKNHIMYILSTGQTGEPNFITSSQPSNDQQKLVNISVAEGRHFFENTPAYKYEGRKDDIARVAGNCLNSIRHALEVENNVSVSGLPQFQRPELDENSRTMLFGPDHGQNLRNQFKMLQPAKLNYEDGQLRMTYELSGLNDNQKFPTDVVSYRTSEACMLAYRNDTLVMSISHTDSYTFTDNATASCRQHGNISFVSSGKIDLSRLNADDLTVLGSARVVEPVTGLKETMLYPDGTTDEYQIEDGDIKADIASATYSGVYRYEMLEALKTETHRHFVLAH